MSDCHLKHFIALSNWGKPTDFEHFANAQFRNIKKPIISAKLGKGTLEIVLITHNKMYVVGWGDDINLYEVNYKTTEKFQILKI